MTKASDRLKDYSRKRDFRKTPEPGTEDVAFDWTDKRPIFVVQKHDASRLHYDFRIEVDGVLRSWAVPKGPSTDPRDKRLAVPTEDHPLAYADFEGVIPKDAYGGGTVLVWDRGSYRNLKEKDENGGLPSVAEQLDKGHATIWLEGEKISGGYALIRTGGGGDARWLLVKMNDDRADARRNPVSTEPDSVKTGRSIDEIRQGSVMRIGGKMIDISNRRKVFFPESGLTKGDLIDYYRQVAKTMLPHTTHYPVSMERYPDGIDREGFFQKEASGHFPEWIGTVTVEKVDGGSYTAPVADSAAALVYLANQAVVTFHLHLSRATDLKHPDRMVFDLDPPEGAKNSGEARRAALDLREILKELDMRAFVQTSGSKGFHVVVALDRRSGFNDVRAFARNVAKVLVNRSGDRCTLEQRKNKRKGRVFVDTLRNAYGATLVAPYAVRPLSEAPVATPLDWKEVESGASPRNWTIKNIARRLDRKKDPWKDIRRHGVSIKKRLKKLEKLLARIDSATE
jgi:bifunctional non-homologous end joining protein LigD